MHIYLMQHGTSLPETIDPEQGVSPVGREEVETSAAAARRMGLEFSDIFCSTKKRARQTAALMALGTGFPEADVAADTDFSPMADPERTLRRIHELRQGGSVLVCGHLPNLNRLACRLLGPGPEFAIAFENAGLLCLSMDGPPRHTARLEWYLRPWQLASLAR
ncbi:MAG: histidine phosphatase family protein [Desulfovibrionaceae bacterium]